MSISFDRVASSRRSDSRVDDFLEDLPHFKEERAEALAELMLSNFQADEKSSPEPHTEWARYESLWWLNGTQTTSTRWQNSVVLDFKKSDFREGLKMWEKLDRNYTPDQVQGEHVATRPREERPTDEKPYTDQAVRVVSLGKMHAVMWTGLVLFALIWGVAAGAAFFAGAGVTPSVATFGVLGTVALAATLFVVSVQDALHRHGR